MKKIALVTGATSGIGRATAIALADEGYNLIITGRRKERLEELKAMLGITYKADVLVLNFDVRDREAVQAAIDSIPAAWKNIDVLVNNAGLAVGLNPIRGTGHIVNLCSTAGKEVYPNGNVYCATKHAVDAISKAMRIDMLKYGIKVTNICPGAVETEFSMVRFKNDKEKADKTYEGYTPLCGEDIASIIRYVVTLPAHVCINDLVVTPTAQANATNIFRKN